MTLSRWRTRLKDPRKFDAALVSAQGRCVKVCEARQEHPGCGRAKQWSSEMDLLASVFIGALVYTIDPLLFVLCLFSFRGAERTVPGDARRWAVATAAAAIAAACATALY